MDTIRLHNEMKLTLDWIIDTTGYNRESDNYNKLVKSIFDLPDFQRLTPTELRILLSDCFATLIDNYVERTANN